MHFRISMMLSGSRARRRCISGRLSVHWCFKTPTNPVEWSNILRAIAFLLFQKTFKNKLQGIIIVTMKKLY